MGKSGRPRKICTPETFYANTSNVGECQNWNGQINRAGYGVLSWEGQMMRANRVSYLLTHGAMPDGLIIRHTCDNRACVNPAHLRAGTFRDNSDDTLRHGRLTQAKLTADIIVDMRLRRDAGETFQAIADYYGVNVSVAHRAITGASYRALAEQTA